MKDSRNKNVNKNTNKSANRNRSGKKKGSNQFKILTLKRPKVLQKKLVILFFIIVLAFIVLVGVGIFKTMKYGDEYKKRILDQQSYNSREIPFKRGDIVDRKGTKLATSNRVYNIILDVYNLLAVKGGEEDQEKAIEDTLEVLNLVFGLEKEEVRQIIEERQNSKYVILKKNVDYNTAKKFEEYDKIKNYKDSDYEKYYTEENPEVTEKLERYSGLRGVWLEEAYIRNYPYNTLASGILGFAGSGNVGMGGIEQYYNETLNGVNGREYGYFTDDATEVTVKEPENGNTVVSTIDQTIQSIVEKHIQEFNEEHKDEEQEGAGSKNTAVVVENPNTGEILASATYPNFDLNNPNDLKGYYSLEEIEGMTEEETVDALNILRTNYVVTSTFEAGSPIKPFTVAAALETGLIQPNDTFYCDGGEQVDDYYIKCVNTNGHGSLTVEEAIAHSCNDCLMQIAAKFEIEEFVKYQNLLGLGNYTGIDLPNEAYTIGLMHGADSMLAVDRATGSFGQGYNTTMIQVLAGYSALVNGGNYYEPHVVKQIQDASGSVIENVEPKLLKKTISERTSEIIIEDLTAVVEYGSGKWAAVDGYSVAGKTGTAEKLPRKDGRYLVSFIGHVPADNPEVVIYIIIDEPNVEIQSQGSYPTKMASAILSEVLPYLGVATIE